MISALIAVLNALPALVKLVEKLISVWEATKKRNNEAVLAKADADVDVAITNVGNTEWLRVNKADRISAVNATPAVPSGSAHGAGIHAGSAEKDKSTGV